jgi:hypothetical protein
MDTCRMAYGLSGMIDAFPFQHRYTPGAAVSIEVAERLFGEAAEGELSRFAVTRVSN